MKIKSDPKTELVCLDWVFAHFSPFYTNDGIRYLMFVAANGDKSLVEISEFLGIEPTVLSIMSGDVVGQHFIKISRDRFQRDGFPEKYRIN